MLEHQGGRRDQLADAESNHSKGSGSVFGCHGPENDSEPRGAEAGQQRHHLKRDWQATAGGGIEEVHHAVAAEAEEDGMTEREQSSFAVSRSTATRDRSGPPGALVQ